MKPYSLTNKCFSTQLNWFFIHPMGQFGKSVWLLPVFTLFLLWELYDPQAAIYSEDTHCKIATSLPGSTPYQTNSATVPLVFDASSSSTTSSQVNGCDFIRAHCDVNYYSIARNYYCSKWYPSYGLLILHCIIILVNVSVICMILTILVSNYLFKDLSHLCHVFGIGHSTMSSVFVPITNTFPDLINFYVAFKANSSDLVLGQLIGSLLILFTIVLGTIAIMNSPYQVIHPKLLLIDLIWVIAVLLVFSYILSDGQITVFECVSMTGIYLFYVVFLSYYDKDKCAAIGDVLDERDRPYNVEDALSILSHQDIRKSPIPVPSNTTHLSPGYLSPPNETDGFTSFDSMVSDYGSISPAKSPILDAIHSVEEFVLEHSINTMNVIVKTIDLGLFLLIPVNSNPIDDSSDDVNENSTNNMETESFDSDLIEDILGWDSLKNSQYLKYWYVMVTALFLNFEFFQLSAKDLIPSISVCMVSTAVISRLLPNYIKELVVDFSGVFLSVIITSNVSIEILQLLKNFGIILRISEYMLGLIAFSLSSCMNDFITNTTISSINPAYGINSCLGTPLITILVGVGINGLIVISQTHHSIKFFLSNSVIVTTVSLVVIMVNLLGYLSLNGWKFNKTIGFINIGWYVVILGINLYLGD